VDTTHIAQGMTEQDKVVSLYSFIQKLNEAKQKIIVKVSDYPWYCSVASIPDDFENIRQFYRDRVEEEEEDTPPTLLSVHKPEFQRCPEPDAIFADWLMSGWDSYKNSASVSDTLQIELSPTEETPDREVEHFADNTDRVAAYEHWIEERELWAKKQQICEKTRNFFTDLYRLYTDLNRDSETMELIVSNGFIRDRDNNSIDHPVLTRRVRMRYNAVNNTISIEDIDVESELYTAIFQSMSDINLASINQTIDELHQNDYHPLDRNDTPEFFKVLIHQLSASSFYADDGIPNDWSKNNRLLLYQNPCYILRKRMDGTLKAIEQIIENVETTGEVPAPIRDIVSGGQIEIPEDTGELSVEEQLAAVGGESVDILLSKEANKEQLEIAHRIERYNAVLVQGPPGTGKTHTIANLMGHFLAQGKSVLVTSHTQKALRVLKEKISPGLQHLCVSILDDSNVDMEKSIDGITDYMSRYTSYEVKREMDELGLERREIINELADTRKKIFAIINRENNCIVFNGEEISPSAAAAYVWEHKEDLSYIPGKVQLYEPLPLTFTELSELYRSNEDISAEEEKELANDLPAIETILTPADFERICDAIGFAKGELTNIENRNAWEITDHTQSQQIEISMQTGSLNISYPDPDAVKRLKDYAESLDTLEPWMQYAATDGKKGGEFHQRWCTLIDQIKKTCELGERLVAEQFGKVVQFHTDSPDLRSALAHLQRKFSQKGKLGKLDTLFNKSLDIALNGVTINGVSPQSSDDCALALHCLDVNDFREQCAAYWDELLSQHGVPTFKTLSDTEQEQIAKNYIPYIERYLNWYEKEYAILTEYLSAVGIPVELLSQHSPLDSDITVTEKLLGAIKNTIPEICRICEIICEKQSGSNRIEFVKHELQCGSRATSDVCMAVVAAINVADAVAYQNAYGALEKTYSKRALQEKRKAYLDRLRAVAPQWADAIADRAGIFGQYTVPSNIEDAWKWKQYYGIIEELTAEPFAELQKKSITLSKRYREITAQYAEKCAWYHLLQRTEHDIDMKQALIGWKLTVKKIGKGTGKNAPMYRAQARELMAKCQAAVPGWIMPISRALESLDPRKNQFDLVIIDEASQSDISALAILYMGKKLVIVGDDKQVSPMAVGMEVDKINVLKDIYLKDKIPNAHLYDAKTSIYDIAATTFQPLMLREHFRCAPEIIGFSNWLSYDFKIKALRDDSNSVLLPAVVNYRVENGQRVGKTNPNEAKTIIALIRACMEQPEYAGKTFGIISLLGDEQVKLIQSEVYQSIDAKVCAERQILCGNASNFQGDERDVIFLSVVDSGNGQGPLAMQGYGADDAYRKRYNVAASRAKDQLWVVDSLDPATDLKPGDIRKQLIDYSINPDSVAVMNEKIEQHAESPFEVSVAQYLAARGYHLVQQWKVGAYRLDMVAVCGKKTVAIECDGERYHSGESKIREDMERQTILERLGWRFIRIRGSEYYCDQDTAMKRVLEELTAFGIEPEESEASATETRSTELLQRVKACARAILEGKKDDGDVDVETIAVALNPGTDGIGGHAPVEALEKLTVPSVEKAKRENPTMDAVTDSKPPVANSPNDIRHPKAASTHRKQASAQQDKQKKTDIIDFLNQAGVIYMDKRPKGGSLWMLGGEELAHVAEQARSLGYKFTFKSDGGQATHHNPGWWTK
jgi:very-short-patch-repair endonuclease